MVLHLLLLVQLLGYLKSSFSARVVSRREASTNQISDVDWNGCNQTLVLEYSTEAGVTLPGPSLFGDAASWRFPVWKDVYLFKKHVSDEPGCTQFYHARCGQGGIVVKKECNFTGNAVNEGGTELREGNLNSTNTGMRNAKVAKRANAISKDIVELGDMLQLLASEMDAVRAAKARKIEELSIVQQRLANEHALPPSLKDQVGPSDTSKFPGIGEACNGSNWPQVSRVCQGIRIPVYENSLGEITYETVYPRCYSTNTSVDTSWLKGNIYDNSERLTANYARGNFYARSGEQGTCATPRGNSCSSHAQCRPGTACVLWKETSAPKQWRCGNLHDDKDVDAISHSVAMLDQRYLELETQQSTISSQMRSKKIVLKDEGQESDLRCLGGKDCKRSQFRMTRLSGDDKVVLKIPSNKGTCDYEMTSGSVQYYVSSGHVDAPAADELATVAGMAAQLNKSGNECGEAAMKIRTHPLDAPKYLRDLAVAARDDADSKGDSKLQIFYSFLALHFEERRHQLSTIRVRVPRIGTLRRKVISDLSQDLREMEELSLAGAPIPLNENHTRGMDALVHYHNGVLRHPLQDAKNRVLIFTCSYGGGHKSAASAVSAYLEAVGYEVVIMDTTHDPQFFNMVNNMSAMFFNEIVIKRQMYGVFNVFDKMQQIFGPLSKPCPSPACDRKRKHQFRTAVLDHQPDLIVTVYHMELLPVLEVAKELGNLPVLHIATDIDIKMNEIFGPMALPVYPKFLVGVPFNLKEAYDTIGPLTKRKTVLSGYPVRAAFLKPVDEKVVAAEKARCVPRGTKLMLVMSGGGGQDVIWPYKLAAEGIGIPFHIVIIAGGNNELEPKLREALPGNKTFPDGRVVWHGKDDNVTVEVAKDPANNRKDKPYFVFEERLALLMDMADVMMSKPGGGSTAEIAYRGVPAVFDTSVTLFHWEQFTVDVFLRTTRGTTFSSEKALRPAILEAIGLGHSQELVQERGRILNTADRVAKAAGRLLRTKCKGRCPLFAKGTATRSGVADRSDVHPIL